MGIGYINFVRFLRETIVMVASSSMVIFFQKDDQLKPINSFHAPHQVTSVATVDFWKCFARHDSSDKEFRWREAVCLGDRFGVSVVDDKGVVISRIDLQDDCELLHFQAFVNTLSTTVDGVDSKHAVVDDKDQGRNGLMILYVRPVDRRRGVVWIKMEQGYREEISRRELERDSLIEGLGKYNPTDSTVMFRDKIAIVNHDRCILNQVHRCELRVVDTANKTCFATERYKEDEESMVMSKFRLKDSHWDNGSDKETMEWEDSESEIEVEVEEEEEDEDWDEEEGEEDGKGEKGEKDEERSKDAKHVETAS
ncbi:hypothetical protein BGW38_004502 [Lunasporangiospora selenospora]|uniref:Uncharacterized protein n=1 Tax=Lunasporangiospora selenospora TaxID=979761 RepID=A0A9P6G184_9FUNG|nr:hypothetical protein BGW38_004502 [Lunasporangiospora selenospora]